MLSKYRDRLQIVADILYIANARARKTRIMYQANLSYKLLCRYLDEVVDAGLVRPEDDECYVLTAKGNEFLGRHEEYTKRCKSLKEHLNSVNDERNVLVRMCSNTNRLRSGSHRPGKNQRQAE